MRYQTGLPTAPRPASPRASRTAWFTRQRMLAVGGAAVVLAGFGTGIALIQHPAPTDFGAVLVLNNVDADVAGNGLKLAEPQVVDAASSLAANGGGKLIIANASGGAARVVASRNLAVTRDGQVEHDAATRNRVISGRVTDAFHAATARPPMTPGRGLLPLLDMTEQFKPKAGLPFTIFYVGLGLSTVDPANARVQMAGDPDQAVGALASQLPKLTGATLHVVFPATAGPQPALNPFTSAWRKQFWVDLAKAMGATLASVDERNIPAPALPDAPSAPVIKNLPDPTVVPKGKSPKRQSKPKANPAPVVLAGANFQPDSPRFVSRAVARQKLTSLSQSWKKYPGRYRWAECTGRTAEFGPENTALTLSRARSAQAATILRSLGVTRVHTRGLGFSSPLKKYPPKDPRQRNVTCQLIPAK